MRKIWIFALAVIGTAVCSCVQEENFEEIEPVFDSGAVSFVLKGVETRTPQVLETFTYKLGKENEGQVFTLEESVSEMGGLGAAAPMTKGSPAYTENVASVYGAFNGVIYGNNALVAGDGSFEVDGTFWRRELDASPWSVADPLTFFLRMPGDAAGLDALSYDLSAKTISFDYETPAKAEDQKDLLFATRTLTKAQYDSEFATYGGAQVLFRHAFTGVKFAIGNYDAAADVQTIITKVVISGLKDKGSAVFAPAGTETNVDDRTEFSSNPSFTWTLNATSTKAFSQTFDASNVVDFTAGDAVNGPASFYAAGANDNLNDQKASLTFWFIPQTITADLMLDVEFCIKRGADTGETLSISLNLGELILAQDSDVNKTWKAGQLRTFTLTPGAVDIEITDDVDVPSGVKDNVIITNTGSKEVYVRVAMIGNWVNTTTGQIVAPWNEGQGTFQNLGGGGLWVKGSDGFWYYTLKLAPGATPNAPIFTSYTKGDGPAGAGLVMDLAVQAIDAAGYNNYAAAWAAATE